MSTPAVVLLSGGIDSCVTMFRAIDRGYEPYPIFFDYGQTAREQEFDAVVRQMARYFVTESGPLKVFRMPDYPAIASSCEMLKHNDLKLDLFCSVEHITVPNRLSVFLSVAGAYCLEVGAHDVFVGLQCEMDKEEDVDGEVIHDVSGELVDDIERLLSKSVAPEWGIKVQTPLLRTSKSNIYLEALDRGVSMDNIWSCLLDTEQPCGCCTSCLPFDRHWALHA